MIDTNIAIHLRDGDPDTIQWLANLSELPLICVFTLIELEGGVFANPDKTSIRRHRLDAILTEIPLVEFDLAIVDVYASIIRACGFSRPRILDRLIAATAIVNDLTLVTINATDLRDIPQLKLAVWPAPLNNPSTP